LLENDMHIISFASNVVLVFTIVARVFSIKVFNVASEVCSLVPKWVGQFYINFSLCFYSQLKFLYFGHIDGILIIC
jgi:hypothetical protein